MNKEPKVSVIIPTANRADQVTNCVASILKSDYSNLEVFVVDNNSADDTRERIQKICVANKKVKLIESHVNLGAGGGRNRGAREASGDFLLFIDSDNVVDGHMISELVKFFNSTSDCGLAGPLMLIKCKPDHIWTYFADINMYSSRAFYKGYGEKNSKQYSEKVLTGHIPNCFIMKRQEFEAIGGFDEKYLIMYEEADLAEKVKNLLKKKIYFFTKAITYHDVPFTKANDVAGFRSPERAFLTARNRVYFMKKNAGLLRFLVFSLIFNPLVSAYYFCLLALNGRWSYAREYLKGNIIGYFGRWQ